MPILTQAQAVNDFPRTRETLVSTRNLMQILEIIDRVTVEGEGQEEIFGMAVEALEELNAETPNRAKVLHCLEDMLENLGFQNMADTKFHNISQYVEFLSDKKMHSFAYLTVKK
jgi:recombinational DNA repair protein (RecF pathway)